MNNIKRSIIFPKELDSIINGMTERYSYQTKSKLIIELLELGILKFNEAGSVLPQKLAFEKSPGIINSL